MSLSRLIEPISLHPQDTLMVSGYSQDESEEVIARVISVIDSHEHFLGQTATILNEVGAFQGLHVSASNSTHS